MAINNTAWVGPPNTQEYIRQLEERLAAYERAFAVLGVRV